MVKNLLNKINSKCWILLLTFIFKRWLHERVLTSIKKCATEIVD